MQNYNILLVAQVPHYETNSREEIKETMATKAKKVEKLSILISKFLKVIW